jgi:DNA-binding NarL/FixJ family response regulator
MSELFTQSEEPGNELTTREREIVLLLARGMVVKVVARHLALSEKTVRNHLGSIYRKLSLSDRAHLLIVLIVRHARKL